MTEQHNGCDTCRLYRRLGEVTAERNQARIQADGYKRERDMLVRWLEHHGQEIDLTLSQKSVLKDLAREVG